MPLTLFPEWIKEQYNLQMHALTGFVYLEMRRAVWGLPQAGILANKLLRRRLLPHGYYYECPNTPGLWKHEWRPISFTLVVDDFGVKYVGKEHVQHLIRCIKEIQIAMMQQPATNYRGCQKMLLLCHRGQPEAWQQCSKIGSMSSYLESAHYPDCTW